MKPGSSVVTTCVSSVSVEDDHGSMEELEPEEQFLSFARNGDLAGIQRLLMSKIKEETQININCRGKRKSNLGWTPLHLACYFGHKDVVEELLKIPKDVTQNAEIRGMLEAAERTEERKLEEELLEAAREGELSTLTHLLSRKKTPDINCTDLLGNTPLHSAAYRGQRQCALKLLKSGASPNIKNKKGQTVFDLASDIAMKLVLESNVNRGMTRHVKKKEGLLWKSSRFFGWRSYWVVLQDGVISWYSKQSDAADNVRRQGCKSLTNAQCLIRAKDSCFFTLKCFDDSVHLFKVSPKNHPEATRKAWIDTLEEHSAYSTHYCSQEQGSEGEEEEEEVMSLGELTNSLQAAEASQKKLEKEVEAFLSLLKNDGLAERIPPAVTQKLQDISELSSETSSSLSVCLSLLSRQEGVRSVKLEQEVEKNKILSEALQTLATEHHELEQSVVKGSSPRSALSEDEFHDALSDSESEISLSGFETASRSFEDEEEEDEGSVMLSSSPCSSPSSMLQEDHHGDKDETQPNGITKHRSAVRTSLPAPMFSRNDFSIWSILRNCIGMELSKITMPVIFNEPLSFLQRLTEYMEHTYLIHQANTVPDSVERMKCVAAFAVSAVASQWERTGKPFNPLLGETFELVRDDLGFRLISEQVSHHPPVSAFHAEGLKQDFVFHGSIYPKLKFWGKSVEAEPKGVITLELPKYNEAYTWTNPTCCVHNIIVGQLWIEQYGNVEVINHRTGERCCLNFKPCGLFGKELHKQKEAVCSLWEVDRVPLCCGTLPPSKHIRKTTRKQGEKKSSKAGCSEDQEEVPSPAADTVEMIPGSQLLWRIAPRPANSVEMYSFTSFAMQLNELHKEMEGLIPQTDCRLRPDIRAMENGDIDLASEEKKRLEDKQRAARKNRSKSDEEWKKGGFSRGKTPTITPRTGSCVLDTGTGNTASCQTFTNGHFMQKLTIQ
ncbi:hypothetical protein F7725_027654 [Dissostichus mawsoni]|uniref:Oxysterol-binding protein n=1 Tax=Dissostichus mawsoni TaxID=36200 RepID=A0A7J5XDH8_DISMA|nr:hypothetical protein F7725_027654 [Dissostichus mawsoni]